MSTRAASAAAAADARSRRPRVPARDDLRALGGRAARRCRREALRGSVCALCDARRRKPSPRADLWCGVAAVDVGRAGEGVLALERYVLRFPDDARGRLELARAYFYAGDNARARAEFEARGEASIRRRRPCRPASTAISTRSRFARRNTARRSSRYVELGGGYDSNANAGVGSATSACPCSVPSRSRRRASRRARPSAGWPPACREAIRSRRASRCSAR